MVLSFEVVSPCASPLPKHLPMLTHSPIPHSQSMPILHLNTSDSSLVSSDMSWDSQRSYSDPVDVVSWNYYTLPPSPPASVSSNTDSSPQLGHKVLRPRFTSESHSESEQQTCLPTNQVFDLDGVEPPSSASSVSSTPPMPHQLSLSSDNEPPLKKSFSVIGGVKKGRGNGERITTKDFVPPDVTGLSKREARLLKNRAAAFLSRQRKREEFEAMEIRVRKLEEENSRLQSLAEKGNKCDDLLASLEQLRLRLSVAEKRERELTVELANRTVANLTVKTESPDLSLPPPSYTPYPGISQGSVISVMRESLLSLLPSLLSLPPQASLPVTFSVPLTSSSSGWPSTGSFNHQPAPCDIKDPGRPRFGHGFHLSSGDVDPSRKMGLGGELAEARQFDMDSRHCPGSFAIFFDTSLAEDGRGCVQVQVSERTPKVALHEDRQRASPLGSWHGADGSLVATCYASPPLSAPISIPSPSGIDHLGIFAGTGSAHPRMGFDTQLMSSGYTPFGHDSEQAFDYYPGLILE